MSRLIRGVPLLVQLLFWYFAFPSVVQGIGKSLNIEALKTYLANPIGMAILGLTFCYAAYMSEIYRAGIQSIPKGQMEAARSLGMTYTPGHALCDHSPGRSRHHAPGRQ